MNCPHTFDWLDTPSLGLQPDGEGGLLDLRNCPGCGSTRARPVVSRDLAGIDDVVSLTEKGWAHAG